MTKKIILTGSSGLIGMATANFLRREGWTVIRLVRRETQQISSDEIVEWDAAQEQIDPRRLEGAEAVVHLSGASIAGKRWTNAYKKVLYDSRIQSTRFLSSVLAKLYNPPKVLLCASAIGYYGSHEPDVTIDESSQPGSDFLAHICKDWEASADTARRAGIRVVHLRFGPVLSEKGGALAQMLPIFRLGVGGNIASGRQMFSWVALDELPQIMNFVIQHVEINGAVNCVSPQPVSNAAFTKILGNVLKRPTILPLPAVGVKILFGEMGETLLIGGAKVLPRVLTRHAYSFRFPDLEQTFIELLQKNKNFKSPLEI